MQPKKVLSIFALGVLSLFPLSQASNDDKGNGKKDNNPARKQIPKTRQQHQAQRRERAVFDEEGKRIVMPTATVADSDFYVSETSRDRCIRESESMKLDGHGKVNFMKITEAHRKGKFPSKAYLKLNDKHPGAQYFPLEKEHLQPSDQKNPSNFMARIMTRYRMDMGFPPAVDQDAPNAASAEVLNFLRCFDDVPQTITQDAEEFAKIVEAYSFLKFLGLIPQNLEIPDECDEIKQNAGIHLFEDILTVYNKKTTAYNLLDWDNLDLTRFKYQNFHVNGKMIKNFQQVFKKEDDEGNEVIDRIYITPPILSEYGINSLKKYMDKIRFHNPESFRGLRMLLFQRIYRKYYLDLTQIQRKKKEIIVVQEPNPYYIDWELCDIENWPQNMSKSRVASWTDEQIAAMNEVLKNGSLKFIPLERKRADAPPPLGKFKGQDESYFTEVRGLTGDQEISISDDEKICGKGDNIVKIGSIMKSFMKSEEIRRQKEETAMDDDDEEAEFDAPVMAKKKKRVQESDEEANFDDKPAKTKKAAESDKKEKEKVYDSDEEAQFDDNYIARSKSSASKTATTKSTNDKPKYFESADGVEYSILKDTSNEPADPKERQELLDRLLEMFRRQTGKKNATEIDWSLSKVHLLQNHILSFSTNFETVGDIKTIENLLKSRYFKFLNLSKVPDRSILAYQELYKIYAAATAEYGKKRNEYEINWKDVEFTGLPGKLSAIFKEWTANQVAFIERALKDGSVSCVVTEKFKMKVQQEESSDEESVSMSGSPSSSSEVQNGDEMVSDSPQSVTEPVINNQAQHRPIGRWVSVPFTPSEPGKTPSFYKMIYKKSPSTNKRKLVVFNESGDEENGGDGIKDDAIINDETNATEEAAGQGKMKQPRISFSVKHVPVGRWITIEPPQVATVAQTSVTSASTQESASSNSVEQGQVIRTGEYAGSTVEEVLAHAASIEESIANYSRLRGSFAERTRHRRIINFIIECLEIILEDTLNYGLVVPPRMGIREVSDYLEVFNDALDSLGPANDIEDAEELKKLVIAMVKFRARLSGASMRYLRGKPAVTITPAIINNNELFGFLTGHEKRWDIPSLDYFIDNDELPVFIRRENRVIDK